MSFQQKKNGINETFLSVHGRGATLKQVMEYEEHPTLSSHGQMDGWQDGWMDGWMDGRQAGIPCL